MKLTPLNLLGSPIIQGLLTRGLVSLSDIIPGILKTSEDPRCSVTVCNHISGPQLQLCPNPQEQDTASDIRVPDWGTSDVNYREGLTLEL